jgi:type IV secretory pathway VirB4 component
LALAWAAPDLRAVGWISMRGSPAAMNALPKEAQLRREASPADRIPYLAHVSPHLVKTRFGDYVQVFRLAGGSFECADDETLNTWHERLNVLWRNLATPNLALWTHLVRRPVQPQAQLRALRISRPSPDTTLPQPRTTTECAARSFRSHPTTALRSE